jgi:hypothetical protein
MFVGTPGLAGATDSATVTARTLSLLEWAWVSGFVGAGGDQGATRVTGEGIVTDIAMASEQATAPANAAHTPRTCTRAIVIRLVPQRALAPRLVPQRALAPHAPAPDPVLPAIARKPAVVGRITCTLTGMAMFTGKQTRAGRKDQVTVGAPWRAARRVHSNGLDNNRQQLASSGPHSHGHTMISTEARMPERTEINDPATIASQQVLAGGVVGADRPGDWQERNTRHLGCSCPLIRNVRSGTESSCSTTDSARRI